MTDEPQMLPLSRAKYDELRALVEGYEGPLMELYEQLKGKDFSEFTKTLEDIFDVRDERLRFHINDKEFRLDEPGGNKNG